MDNSTNPLYPVHPRYRPRDPTEVQFLASSVQVIRQSDNASFLATKIPEIVCRDVKAETANTSLASCILPVASKPISLILNHPNIISLIDIIRTSDFEGAISEPNEYKDLLVWEDMKAGSLAYLLPSANSYPAFNDEEAWHLLATQNFQRFSLPESLCWHVLRSMSRALMWLHHGIKETEGITGDFLVHDEDWHALLIRDISPGQIWFQKPKGKETYGLCKLGGFQWAQVCGSVGGKVAVAQRQEDAPRTKQYFWAPEIYKDTLSWSRASEIWSLGAVIYTMMTGIPPPRYYEYNWQISRMNDKGFSRGLRDVVSSMLKHHPSERPKTVQLVSIVEDNWEGWRATTMEGAMYVDVEDERTIKRAAGMSTGII